MEAALESEPLKLKNTTMHISQTVEDKSACLKLEMLFLRKI